MSKKLYTEAYIQNIADAIREKNGLTRKYMVGEMAQAIQNIPAGSDLLALASGSEAFDLNDETLHTEATAIPQYMFYDNDNVRDISLSSILSVGQYSFYRCDNLRNVILPECTLISANAFLECRRNATGNTLYLPKVVTIGNSAFKEFGLNNSNLDLNLAECVTLEDGAFRSAYANYGFTVKTLSLPKIENIGQLAFQNLTATTLTIGANVEGIGQNAFLTTTITNLYCYATTPPPVTNNNLGSGNITNIYVPSGCGNAYKAAGGWSAYENQIHEIT